eukprot:12848762-Alexandrium_andersonii.AAC.1
MVGCSERRLAASLCAVCMRAHLGCRAWVRQAYGDGWSSCKEMLRARTWSHRDPRDAQATPEP